MTSPRGWWRRLVGTKPLRLVFGDRTGLLLFLAVLVFFGLYWRVDVFITDSTTLVNGLGALGDGTFFIQQPVLGSSLDSPGMHQVSGGPVARNYGEILPALPILWALRALGAVANLHVVVVAGWHLLLLGVLVLVGEAVGRARLFRFGGSAIVFVLFVSNLVLAERLPDFAPYVLSLQLLTLVAAGLTVVVMYRLLSSLYDRRLGVGGGVALAVATPVGFWATLPKRHIFTGLAVTVMLYSMHRSRTVDPADRWTVLHRSTAFRAMAYATVGLYAWIHAGEALFMLGALAIVDLPTGPRTTIRTLTAIGIAFALSLLPMILTNLAIAGDPLAPPRLLPDYVPSTTGGDGTLPGGEDVFGGSGATTGMVGVLVRVRDITLGGLATLSADYERIYHTYVRSRSVAEMTLGGGGGQLRYAAANLSVLESMPLATGLFAAVGIAIKRVRRRVRALADGLTATDGLALVMSAAFAVLYADSLPLVAQYTQRYLFPVFPLALYGLARLPVTHRSLADHWRLGGWVFAVTVLIGGQLLFVFVVVQNLSVGEAFQLHALLNLSVGVVLVLALSGAVLHPQDRRPAAAALGLAAGVGAVFVLLSGVVYFPIGPYVLPMVEALSELIAAA